MGSALPTEITGAKGGEKKPKAPYEAPDSLRSTNVAKVLLAVGEGEFDGTPTDREIYLDNTPIMDASGNVNFPGVKWEWRSGAIEQDYIQGIPAVESETSVGVELRNDAPWTRALSNTQLSAVRLRFSWPRLLSQDPNTGDTNGYRIEYAVDVATDGGAFVEANLGAVDGKTTSTYQRSVRVDLPKALTGWTLRVRRLTPNQNTGAVADTMTIAGYTEIIDQKLRYPNTALLYIEFDAEQFQNIPSVTVKCKARRWPVPTNYDPIARSYSGTWDGTFKQAWTNNPAFVTYGLCAEDRFGLGKRIKSWMVDKWEMYRIAQYCDQLVPDGVGGQEPRFLCDMNLQGKAEAWTLLRDLSAIYRGMVYWAQGSLFMQADMPRAQDFDYVFTRANVIDGEFTYGGAERSTHYSRALVSYDNPGNNYDTDVIPVTDLALQRRYQDRPIEISAIGCTRASEAQRRGKWALLSNNQDRTVTFKTGMEGRIPLPGHVIPVADELLSGRPNGGRIATAAGKIVTLDRDTQIKTGDRLIINLPNGSAQGRTVASVAGRAVTVTTAYSAPPEPELQWAIDADDLAVQLFRVLKTSRTAEGEYEITALEFNPSKFAAIDTGAKLEERPISIIPVTTVPPPARVTLTSGYAIAQGLAVSTMTIAWPAVEGAVAYDVEWRKDSGNWIRLQRTGTASVDVVGIYAGQYLARVRAVSAFDIMSTWRSSALTELKGKEGAPPAVSFLTTTPLVYGTRLKWGFPAGAEDTQRTELWQSKTTDRADAVKLGDFAYPQAEHEIHGLMAGVEFFYWARLVDRTGNIGPWYPAGVGVQGRSSSDQSEYEEYFRDKIGNGALYPELRKEIELISGDGPGSVNDRVEQAKDELYERIDQLTDALAYDPAKAYAKGEVVRQGQRLFQAIVPVPVGAAPPDVNYWADIGTILETANALALQVQQNTADIETIDGKVTASASQMNALQAAWREDDGEGDLADALRGWDSAAKFAQEVRVRANENEATVTRLTSLDAQVADNKANITTLEQVVATNDRTTATRMTQLGTEVDDNRARLTTVEEAQTTTDEAIAGLRTTVDSVYTAGREDSGEGDLLGALDAWKSKASFASEVRTLANADQALARKSETLEASIGETRASVQQVSEAVVGVDGRVRAQTTIKAQTITGGRKVMAGLSVGVDGDTSEILAFAQRFAVVDEVSGNLIVPFVVQSGQVFINQAVINTAFIQQIVLGMTLRSQAVNAQGLPLIEINLVNGSFIVRGQDASGSTLLNNGGLYVYDANGVERTAVGRLY
ncbi:phage tail protein [Pseudomonas entomophila]|uniref:phage tail protein n=1 Tax=Pseudomonas entomophila TaxID=312306 RepID=UPI0024061AF3|nr:phage tail protein [Pseudomonas entomophila]MDF9617030.1 phage tail protein [Pseudomonas entomophila]